MVPHHSTDYAINCLTAQIGRDAVGLVVYGRSLKVRVLSPNIYRMPGPQRKKKVVFFFFSSLARSCHQTHITHVGCPTLTIFFFFFKGVGVEIFYTALTRDSNTALARHRMAGILNASCLDEWPLINTHTRKKKEKKEERERRCCSFEQIYRTMGLISADRSNKTTLLLTIPRSIKVVCNGFISSNI